MWIAISEDYVLQKLDHCLTVQISNRLHFHPLGEFIHHDQDMGQVPSSRLEWSDHVEAPNSEWPGDGNRLQGWCRQVNLLAEQLASPALPDYVLCHT